MYTSQRYRRKKANDKALYKLHSSINFAESHEIGSI